MGHFCGVFLRFSALKGQFFKNLEIQSFFGTFLSFVPNSELLRGMGGTSFVKLGNGEGFPQLHIFVQFMFLHFQNIQEPKTLCGKNWTLYCRAAFTSAAKMAFTWKKNSKALYPFACEAGVKTYIKIFEHSFDGKGTEITDLGSTDTGR